MTVFMKSYCTNGTENLWYVHWVWCIYIYDNVEFAQNVDLKTVQQKQNKQTKKEPIDYFNMKHIFS